MITIQVNPLASLYVGDCREGMASMPAASVQCCVTPPLVLHESNVPDHFRQYFTETEASPVPCTALDPFRRIRNDTASGDAVGPSVRRL